MSRKQLTGALGALVGVISIVAGLPATLIGGGVLLATSLLILTRLTRVAMDETRPGVVLRLDALMMGAVVIGLIGIGLMGLALP